MWVNAIVKYIGYPLASMLVDKLIQAIREIYTDKVVEKTNENTKITQGERRAIVLAISKAHTDEERKNLSILLSKLGG